MSTYRSQHGFSLVEALVSLVVISVGMIGIASMYGQGLSASRTAIFRTQAVNLASDMADRIRINRQGGVNYGGAAADNGCDPAGGATCTPAEMAAHDLFLWTTQIGQQLPNGGGAVAFTAGDPPTYTINVTWDDVGVGAVMHSISVQVPDL